MHAHHHALTEDESELVECFRTLSPDSQKLVSALAAALAAEALQPPDNVVSFTPR